MMQLTAFIIKPLDAAGLKLSNHYTRLIMEKLLWLCNVTCYHLVHIVIAFLTSNLQSQVLRVGPIFENLL